MAPRLCHKHGIPSDTVDGDLGGHGVGLGGGEGDGVGGDVAGFDAEHVGPFFVAEVGHGFGFGDPGVPDDGVFGILFGDGDFALFCGVFDGDGGGGVEVDAVGFARDGDGALLGFFFHGVGFVDVLGLVEAEGMRTF